MAEMNKRKLKCQCLKGNSRGEMSPSLRRPFLGRNSYGVIALWTDSISTPWALPRCWEDRPGYPVLERPRASEILPAKESRCGQGERRWGGPQNPGGGRTRAGCGTEYQRSVECPAVLFDQEQIKHLSLSCCCSLPSGSASRWILQDLSTKGYMLTKEKRVSLAGNRQNIYLYIWNIYLYILYKFIYLKFWLFIYISKMY